MADETPTAAAPADSAAIDAVLAAPLGLGD